MAISILHIYRWNKVSRICFEIESTSDSQTHYNVCFSNDAAHGTCGCEGFEKWHKDCKHLKALRPQAAQFFESRKPVQSVQKEDWTETAQFGAQVHKMEMAPSGRLVPMR